MKASGADRLRGVLPATMYTELQRTAQMCYGRGLFQASKWAAEMACSLDPSIAKNSSATTSPPPPSDPAASLALLHLAARDLPQALSCSEKLTSPQGRFLHLYCKYMDGEQQRNASVSVEELIGGKSDSGNPHLLSIRRDLEEIPLQERDSFIFFLYGAVLAQLHQQTKAVEALLKSVQMLPTNYAAWQELLPLYKPAEVSASSSMQLPVHWMATLFEALLHLEMRQGELALAPLNELRRLLPNSAFLMANTALAHYMNRNFAECEALFEMQIQRFPKRTDHLDVFSNQLHVEKKLTRLARLAEHVQHIAPYRPETACIVGNYYSLRGEHERALASFIQALKFNRRYLSAWLLLGYEFAELKNANAAAQVYQRTLAINSYEYRAWFSLGQLFDRTLHTPRLAIFYYLRATRLKPSEQRLWCTLGYALAAAEKEPALVIAALERARDTAPAVEKLIEIYTAAKNDAKVAEWQAHLESLQAEVEEEEEEAEGEGE